MKISTLHEAPQTYVRRQKIGSTSAQVARQKGLETYRRNQSHPEANAARTMSLMDPPTTPTSPTSPTSKEGDSKDTRPPVTAIRGAMADLCQALSELTLITGVKEDLSETEVGDVVRGFMYQVDQKRLALRKDVDHKLHTIANAPKIDKLEKQIRSSVRIIASNAQAFNTITNLRPFVRSIVNTNTMADIVETKIRKLLKDVTFV